MSRGNDRDESETKEKEKGKKERCVSMYISTSEVS
jgi:hypothetical protein